MKHPARLFVTACLATIIAGAGSGVASAAEVSATQQDLANVKTSDQVISATWKRQQGFYTLQIVIDQSRFPVRAASLAAVDGRPTNVTTDLNSEVMRQLGVVDVASPQLAAPPGTPERASYFIGNTIANLRDLDPAFCGRTLTLVDGRRGQVVQHSNVALPPGALPIAATPPGMRDRRVEVWLLKAGGAQLQPDSYVCEAGSRTSRERNDVSVSYGYVIPDDAQPVAASIRIGDAFYIEKLQPLASAPAVQ